MSTLAWLVHLNAVSADLWEVSGHSQIEFPGRVGVQNSPESIMSIVFYKVLHIFASLLLFMALGALAITSSLKDMDPAMRKRVAISDGAKLSAIDTTAAPSITTPR